MAKQSQCRVWVRAWEFDHLHRSYSRLWRSKLSGKEIGVDVIVFNGTWEPGNLAFGYCSQLGYPLGFFFGLSRGYY